MNTTSRARWALFGLLVVAGGMRVVSAARAPLELIERDEFIPAAMSLSLDHLPIRVAQHAAVPLYLIRASAMIFGESHLGLRMLSVVAGMGTILLLYLIAARWWGPVPAVAAASLLTIDRYHATISARAIDLPFDLFFIALAMFCFSRFLHGAGAEPGPSDRGRWLHGAAAASALGFLCKELTALMVPVLFVSLITTRQTAWLQRREPWLALMVFGLLIAPDVYSSVTVTEEDRTALWQRHQEAASRLGAPVQAEAYPSDGLYMSYGDHLSRFRSLGFNAEPFYFYFGEIFDRAGIPHRNEFGEFPFMYPAVAAVLWAGVAFGFVHRPRDRLTVFLLTMFVMMFTPFVLVELGPPHGGPAGDAAVWALWYWVDRTMLPATLLAGRAVGACVGSLSWSRRPRLGFDHAR
jgi:4-amino-4-deoxy-L-arabinose transferase-like glycosyltransferase